MTSDQDTQQRLIAQAGQAMNRILIVADHSFVVQSIRLALRQASGFEIVGQVDGRHPIKPYLDARRPNIILVDDMQSPGDALARLRESAEATLSSKRLLLTLNMNDDWLDEAFEAGADAVISKSIHPVALGTLLRETMRGNIIHCHRPARSDLSATCPLTAREVEIVGLAAQGHTNGRIARQLWITEQTVKFHLSNIYRKLGVSNRTEASRYVYANSLVPVPAPALEPEPQALAS
jgi:DNA-binding NarL/FixJ family response regulator